MKYSIFTIGIFFLLTAHAHAASFALHAPAHAIVGDQVSVDVVADTGGTPINSVEASLTYPNDLLVFSGYQETAGIIRFWIEPPHTTTAGTVSFAGGIPGGADHSVGGNGSSLALVRLLFTVKAAGTASVSVDHATMLENDGKGTPLAHTSSGASIAIAGTTTPAAAATSDTTAPLPFSISYIPRDATNNTPALISFSTTDRESGIARYQVKLGWGRWHDAASPYPVRPALFSYRVQVRAIDLGGNVQQSSTTIPGMLPQWLKIAALVVIAGGFYVIFVVKKRV